MACFFWCPLKIIITFLFLISSTFATTAITTSGGVSLGAYKGGFLYYFTEFLKKNPELAKISHIAGASAGGVNTIYAVDTLCSNTEVQKNDSLFWKTWINTGINQLFDEKKVTPVSVFHRGGLDGVLKKLKDKFRNGYTKKCNLTVGIPITSKRPFNMIDHKRVYFASLRNYFVFTIKGNGVGRPVSFSNLTLKTSTRNQLLLPFSNDFDSNFELVKKAMYATSAFPIAFSPVKIKVCDKKVKLCDLKNAKEQEFLDGGVYDNTPLSLTDLISKQLFPKTYKKTNYYYLNSSNHAFKVLDTSSITADEEEETLSSMVAHSLTDLIDISRNSAQATFLKENLDIVDRVSVSHTLLPPLSSPLYAFMGFYDIDFRNFDFELGMSDAREFIEDKFGKKKLGLPLFDNGPLHKCFDMVRFPGDESFNECKNVFSKISPNLQKLLQLELFRSHRFCKSLKSKENRFKKQCDFHHRSEDPTVLITNTNSSLYRPFVDDEETESEVNYMLRVLDSLSYDYIDLNHTDDSNIKGVEKVYLSQREMLDALRDNQPVEEAAIISVLETYLLQNLDYIPPSSSLYFNFGTALEIGVNKNFPTFSKSINFQLSVFALDYQTYLGTEANNVALSPTIGLNISPRIFHYDNYRFSLGLQLGRQFSAKDSYGSQQCSSTDYRASGSFCSGTVGVYHVGVNVFDRINLKLGYMLHARVKGVRTPKTGFLMIGYNFF